MENIGRVLHSLEPVYHFNSRILILGTMPSVKSRETQFYYGNPRNRFWSVLSSVLQCTEPQNIRQKKEMLLRERIALYDVLAACDIHGSADASIRNAVPNDFSDILQTADIKMVYANGKTAFRLYQKLCFSATGRECICLKSTSPANASADFESLVRDWKQILVYL
ncbi:MAG: DNA-deoxyinosine glycosylase [Christensenella sp.]|nr:DNA-deoxyinosine glycosylase [Christensenella sp.]